MATQITPAQTVTFQRNAYEAERARHVDILGRAGTELERALLAFILRAGKAERLALSVGQTQEAVAFNGLGTVAQTALSAIQPFVSQVGKVIPAAPAKEAAGRMTRAQQKAALLAEARKNAGIA